MNLPITHSASGGIVGVFHWVYGDTDVINIFICDVTSGTYMHSHSFSNGIPLSRTIWTHGESFRFATADAATITIWEVGFTSDATCMQVEILRTPVGFVSEDTLYQDKDKPSPDLLLTHTFEDMILLAYANLERILVWDIRDSKCLLHCEDARSYRSMSFSSDGRFLTCITSLSTIYLWKESQIGRAHV